MPENTICIYVGEKSQQNLRVGLQRNTWGFKDWRPEYAKLAVGDRVLIASGFSGGSPRVQPDAWRKNSLRRLIVGTVTRPFFKGTTPLWPDEEGGIVYPERFEFKRDDDMERVPLLPSAALTGEESELLRWSGINKGQGGILSSRSSSGDVSVRTASVGPSVPAGWKVLLERMRRSAEKPHYKPVALLIALDMIEGGFAPNGVIPFDEFSYRFSRVVIDTNEKTRAFMPFFHLSEALAGTTGAWALASSGSPVQFDTAVTSEGQLRRLANEAVVRPDLFSEFTESRKSAASIRRSVESMLGSPDDNSIAALRKRLDAARSTAGIKHARRYLPAAGRSQGRGLTPGKRRAIEEWAVQKAREHFELLELADVGATKSWDLEDNDPERPFRIEVKGSTLLVSEVILTANEVDHAKAAGSDAAYDLALVVVSSITLTPAGGEDNWVASGGEVQVFDPWEIEVEDLKPSQFYYRLPTAKG